MKPSISSGNTVSPLTVALTSSFFQFKAGGIAASGGLVLDRPRYKRGLSAQAAEPIAVTDVDKITDFYGLLERVATQSPISWPHTQCQSWISQAANLLHFFFEKFSQRNFWGILHPVDTLQKENPRLREVYDHVWRKAGNEGLIGNTRTKLQLLSVQLTTPSACAHYELNTDLFLLRVECALATAMQQLYGKGGWVVAYPHLLSQSLLSELPGSLFMEGQHRAYQLASGSRLSRGLLAPKQMPASSDFAQSLYFLPFVWGQPPMAGSAPLAAPGEHAWDKVTNALNTLLSQYSELKPSDELASSEFKHGTLLDSPASYCDRFSA